MTFFKRPARLAGSLLLAAMIATPFAGTAQGQSAAEPDREAVEQIVRDYLLSNPEILIEMQGVLETRQEERRRELQARTLSEKHDAIYNSANNAVFGDPDAPVTVVEFFDYNCGYCRRAMEDMLQIVEENPDVKFVLKEWPVLGPDSLQAHRVSVAMIHHFPDLYEEFHRELLGAEGRKNGEAALQLAEMLGADRAVLEAEADKEYITDAIREAYDLADGLGISGTPAYIIGDEVVGGARGYGYLMPRIANLRDCGKATC